MKNGCCMLRLCSSQHVARSRCKINSRGYNGDGYILGMAPQPNAGKHAPQRILSTNLPQEVVFEPIPSEKGFLHQLVSLFSAFFEPEIESLTAPLHDVKLSSGEAIFCHDGYPCFKRPLVANQYDRCNARVLKYYPTDKTVSLVFGCEKGTIRHCSPMIHHVM